MVCNYLSIPKLQPWLLQNFGMNIQNFVRTLSGPSRSFQDHIYASVVLYCHEINQRIISKVYHDTYKLHKKFLRIQKFRKFPIFLECFEKYPFSCVLSFFVLIFVEIFEKSPFFRIWNHNILDGWNIFFWTSKTSSVLFQNFYVF